MGQYILKQFGPELWTVLGYRFANSQMAAGRAESHLEDHPFLGHL